MRFKKGGAGQKSAFTEIAAFSFDWHCLRSNNLTVCVVSRRPVRFFYGILHYSYMEKSEFKGPLAEYNIVPESTVVVY